MWPWMPAQGRHDGFVSAVCVSPRLTRQSRGQAERPRRAALDASVKPGHDGCPSKSITYVIAGLDPVIQGPAGKACAMWPWMPAQGRHDGFVSAVCVSPRLTRQSRGQAERPRRAALDASVKPGHDGCRSKSIAYVITGLDPVIQGPAGKACAMWPWMPAQGRHDGCRSKSITYVITGLDPVIQGPAGKACAMWPWMPAQGRHDGFVSAVCVSPRLTRQSRGQAERPCRVALDAPVKPGHDGCRSKSIT